MKTLLTEGDSVRYTGRYRDACSFVRTDKAYGGIEGWTVVRFNAARYILFARNRATGSAETAFYAADMELAAPAEPEEYETWFV